MNNGHCWGRFAIGLEIFGAALVQVMPSTAFISLVLGLLILLGDAISSSVRPSKTRPDGSPTPHMAEEKETSTGS